MGTDHRSLPPHTPRRNARFFFHGMVTRRVGSTLYVWLISTTSSTHIRIGSSMQETLPICIQHSRSIQIMDCLFHLALFATFFSVFFYLRVRVNLHNAEVKIARLIGIKIAQATVPTQTPSSTQSPRQTAPPALLATLKERADQASVARHSKNIRSFWLSMIPTFVLWAIVLGMMIYNARSGETHGKLIRELVARTMAIFVCFCVFEMALFALVVSKYVPVSEEELMGFYVAALKKRIGDAPPPSERRTKW